MKVGFIALLLPLPCTVVAPSARTHRPKGSKSRTQGFPQQVRIPVSDPSTVETCSGEMLDRNEGIRKVVERMEETKTGRQQTVEANGDGCLCNVNGLRALHPKADFSAGLSTLPQTSGDSSQAKDLNPSLSYTIHPLLEPNVLRAMREIKFVFNHPPYFGDMCELWGAERELEIWNAFISLTVSTYYDAFSRIHFRHLKISVGF